MTWGTAFQQVYAAASDQTRVAAAKAMSTWRAAGAAVEDLANEVAQSAHAAIGIVGRVGKFAGAAGLEGIRAEATLAAHPYDTVKKLFYGKPSVKQTAVQPCATDSIAEKETRLAKRLNLISSAQRSADPATRKAGGRLAENNEAVELARLSKNAYDQPYGTDAAECVPAPLGWTRVSDAELGPERAKLAADSRASIYRTPVDWPGGQKTVVAFRGTDGIDDVLADHDQAMGLPQVQYKAAMELGRAMQEPPFDSDKVIATGHSLGGGKVQAFVAVTGGQGVAFNAAGLNPNTVSYVTPSPDQVVEYRTEGDPLTGVQNSPSLQAIALGLVAVGSSVGTLVKQAPGGSSLLDYFGGKLPAGFAERLGDLLPRAVKSLASEGQIIPPAIGRIHEIQAVKDDGSTIPLLDPSGQHSIDSVIHGIERQKDEDVRTIEIGTALAV